MCAILFSVTRASSTSLQVSTAVMMNIASTFDCMIELVAIYRDEIVPRATIITPNQFEAEQLTGVHS